MNWFTQFEMDRNNRQIYERAISFISDKTGLTSKQVGDFIDVTAKETIFSMHQIVVYWIDHVILFGRNLDFRKSFLEDGMYITASALLPLYKPSDVDAYAEEEKKPMYYYCQFKDVESYSDFYVSGVKFYKVSETKATTLGGPYNDHYVNIAFCGKEIVTVKGTSALKEGVLCRMQS